MYASGITRADPTVTGILGTYQFFCLRAVESSQAPAAQARAIRATNSSLIKSTEPRNVKPRINPKITDWERLLEVLVSAVVKLNL
jgi:hypothetical protein